MKKVSLLLLLLALPAWSSTVPAQSRCALYMRDFFGVSYFEPSRYWRSETLTGVPLSSRADGVERARRIARQFFFSKGPLFDEALARMPGWVREDSDSAQLVFFRGLEMLNYAKAFSSLAQEVDESLPREGNILILGGGTGALPGYLVRQAPARRLALVEAHPPLGLLATRRLEMLLPLKSQPLVLVGLIGANVILRDLHYDSVVVSHFLYRVGRVARERFFGQLADALGRGGNPKAVRLILTEPLQGRESRVPSYALRALDEAVQAGAPHTDFDAAIVALTLSGSALQALSGTRVEMPEHLSDRMILNLASQAGFQLIDRHEAADGINETFRFGLR